MNPTQTKFAADDKGVLRSWDETLQSLQSGLNPSMEQGFRACNYQASKRFTNTLYRDIEQLESNTPDDDLEPVSREHRKLIQQLRATDQNDEADALIKERKKSTKQQIQSKIIVTVSFNHIPRIDLPTLQAIAQLNFITEDVFARIATGLNGIAPGDALLTQKDRDKEAERKRKIEVTNTEEDLKMAKKYAPAKPGAKPAAKPAFGGGGSSGKK